MALAFKIKLAKAKADKLSFLGAECNNLKGMIGCRDYLIQKITHLNLQCSRIHAWVASNIFGVHKFVVHHQHHFLFAIIHQPHRRNRTGADSKQLCHLLPGCKR